MTGHYNDRQCIAKVGHITSLFTKDKSDNLRKHLFLAGNPSLSTGFWPHTQLFDSIISRENNFKSEIKVIIAEELVEFVWFSGRSHPLQINSLKSWLQYSASLLMVRVVLFRAILLYLCLKCVPIASSFPILCRVSNLFLDMFHHDFSKFIIAFQFKCVNSGKVTQVCT
jgi:hypothetical protein